MRIVHIAAGAGTMHCGACARDATLARGILAHGHELSIVPLYTPLHLDDERPLPLTKVYFSGINVWLRHAHPVFSLLPAPLVRLFENGSLLRCVSALGMETRPAKLGALTVSVLSGREGQQKQEVARLLAFLEGGPRPEVICLTNSLLSSLAGALKERLQVPVVCAVQGEDSFIEGLSEPHQTQARDLLRKHARSVDLYVAPSAAHAEKMRTMLALPAEKIQAVGVGVDIERHQPPLMRPQTPLVIGYLSAIIWRKGLDLLVDAFVRAAGGRRDIELHVAGQIFDKDYYASLVSRLRQANLLAAFRYHGELNWTQKLAFLQRCNVFSLPSRIAESRGMAVLEALACGVPAVVPDTGLFPELAARHRGVVLFKTGDAADLAAKLARLADNSAATQELGHAAAADTRTHCSAAQMVTQTLELYRDLCARKGVPAASAAQSPVIKC